MVKLSDLKRKFFVWVGRSLDHYTTEHDPAKVIDRYRSQGMRIGTNTVVYDCDLDGLLPQLITIGTGCILTHCTVLCHDDSSVVVCGRRIVAPVSIGDRCFIGHGSLILHGVTIGDDCIVAARAVVTKSVAAGSIVGGIPAKVLGTTDDYKKKLVSDPRLLDVPLSQVCTIPQEAELLRAALARHRPDLL